MVVGIGGGGEEGGGGGGGDGPSQMRILPLPENLDRFPARKGSLHLA